MEIDVLRLLIDVSKVGSFAATARAHNLDPSSVSRIVSQAEHELGIRIFQRTTRRLSLTETGQTFVQRIAPMVEEYDRAIDVATNEQAHLSGKIRITASVAYGHMHLLPLLADYRRTFPDLEIELILSDANLDLVADGIDLAIRLAPSVQGDLICSKLRKTRYRVCASPAFLKSAAPLKKPIDLANHQSLLFALDEYRTRWLFRKGRGRTIEVPVRGKIVISNAMALRKAALEGLGPVLLADWLIDNDIKSARLVDVFPDHDVTATSFDTAAWLVYPSREFLPARVRQTIDFLRVKLAKL